AASTLTFPTLLGLIWGQMETCLNQRMIQHRGLVATSHKGEASQLRQCSARALLSVEPQQGALLWERRRSERATNGPEALTQFLSGATVAPVATRAEPWEAVGLTTDGPCTDSLPALAPPVARGTHVIESAKGRRQVFGLRQRSLARCLTCSITVKNHPGVSRSIHQSPGLLLRHDRTAEQIVEKERASGFHGFRCQRCQTGRKCRARGELVTLKQGHDGDGKGMEPCVEGFQGAFTTDGIPEENRENIDHLGVPETSSRNTHLLTDLGQDTVLAKIPDDQHDFPEPGRRRGNGLGRGWDDHSSIGDPGHRCLLEGKGLILPSQRGTGLSLFATG